MSYEFWDIFVVIILQNVLQFQSRGTLAARLSGVPWFFCPKTPLIAPFALPAQFTVGVEGSSWSEVSLFDRLDRAIRHRW
jgi:hypothetical protein